MSAPWIAVGPSPNSEAADAIRRGGGVRQPSGWIGHVTAGEHADGLVWLSPDHAAELRAVLTAAPETRWIQLAEAGVESFAAESLFGGGRIWTSAKGANSEPVAEHALALALAGLRMFPERIRATEWGKPGGRSLYDQAVTILGGGGIARTLIGLLAPLRVHVTVVRRQPDPIPGAERMPATEQLSEALPGVLVIFLALALTPQTTGIISAPELTQMDADAWLVNVARGPHVDTPALVEALQRNQIGGAALDVTEPEPLPAGHPLWRLPNCIVTPHTAGTQEMVMPRLAARIAANVAHFAAGQQLDGLIDANAGY